MARISTAMAQSISAPTVWPSVTRARRCRPLCGGAVGRSDGGGVALGEYFEQARCQRQRPDVVVQGAEGVGLAPQAGQEMPQFLEQRVLFMQDVPVELNVAGAGVPV